jgi:hypothetical protein
MIRIRIGAKKDKCRSVYGILYNEDGDHSDATSFWTGILDGNTNIAGHTKDEVMNSYQSRVLDAKTGYKSVCNVKLKPIGNISNYDRARKIIIYLQKGRRNTSSPEAVLSGLPMFMTTMGVVVILGLEDNGLASKSAQDFKTSLQSIQGSCPWAF